MSELKGQLLGIVLTIIVFTIVFTAMTMAMGSVTATVSNKMKDAANIEYEIRAVEPTKSTLVYHY